MLRMARVVLAFGVALVGMTATARSQTILRPRSRIPATSTAPTVQRFTYTPRTGVMVGPTTRNYTFWGYGTQYGAMNAGAGAYAGLAGFPRFGYSSRFGDASYGYGAYQSYYGYPGYNQVGAPYAIRGYQGAFYGPGFTPNVGYGAGYVQRGYGAYAPLGR